MGNLLSGLPENVHFLAMMDSQSGRSIQHINIGQLHSGIWPVQDDVLKDDFDTTFQAALELFKHVPLIAIIQNDFERCIFTGILAKETYLINLDAPNF